MNAAMLSDWENIIGKEKVRLISTRFFDNRLNSEFPNLGNNDYARKKRNILSELETTGNLLIECEKDGFLTHDEVQRMIDATARELIGRSMPGALFENVSLMLDEKRDQGEEEWLDRELKHIGRILDSFKPAKKQYE
ncbi:MAG: hypothetical protein ABIH80_07110 [Methanobacteriota archaeon]